MSDVTDHRLDAMLVALTSGAADAKASARGASPRKSKTRTVLDIVLWSALTNLALLACFLVGWNYSEIRQHFSARPAAALAISGKTTDPLAVSRYEREDNELLTRGPQRQLKGPLQLTLVPTEQPQPAQLVTGSLPDGAAIGQDQGDGAGEITTGPEDPANMSRTARAPVLRRSPTTGEVEIGSFTTVSLPGSSSDCLETAYLMLEDAGAPRDRLKVLAESPAITVARICAANGSVVVTCRLDQITLSPRRLKPNETCTG